MKAPQFDASVVVRTIAAYLNENSGREKIREFDPEVHKIRRWNMIAQGMHALTSEFQVSYSIRAGGEQAFFEIEPQLCDAKSSQAVLAELSKPENIEGAVEAYELLLHEDFAAGSWSDKNSANTAVARRHGGAFYTPSHLADECVRIACQVYVQKKLGIETCFDSNTLTESDKRAVLNVLSGARVVDPSCGVGRFLVAYIQLVRDVAVRWFSDSEAAHWVQALPNNLWGYDVDPIALGLARLSIASALVPFLGNGPASVRSNMVLGNLLVKPTIDRTASSAIDDIRIGNIYSSSLTRPVSVQEGAFDIVIGNPPWEKIRLEDRDFLGHLHVTLKLNTIKNKRDEEVDKLRSTAPKVFQYLGRIRAGIELARFLISKDSWFTHSAHGELNTCSLFVELGARLINPTSGVSALLVKTSIVTHYANRRLFQYILRRGIVNKIFEFSNKGRIFPIDSRERFSLLVLAPNSDVITFGMQLVQPIDLRCKQRQTSVTMQDLELLNPDSGMLPMPQGLHIFELLKKIYGNNTVFAKNYPMTRFGRLVHLTMHAKEISPVRHPGWLAVQEGKFIERYDGRYSSFKDVPDEKRYTARSSAIKIDDADKQDAALYPVSRYFISPEKWERLTKNYTEPWSLFWRSTTSASNARTCIATLLPHVPAIQSLQMAQFPGLEPVDLAVVLAVMNSKVFDFIIRNKLSGIDLTQTVIGQAAVPVSEKWTQVIDYLGRVQSLRHHVAERVAALLAGDDRLSAFTAPLNGTMHAKKPTENLTVEIDELVAIAYGLTPGDQAIIINFMRKKPVLAE